MIVEGIDSFGRIQTVPLISYSEILMNKKTCPIVLRILSWFFKDRLKRYYIKAHWNNTDWKRSHVFVNDDEKCLLKYIKMYNYKWNNCYDYNLLVMFAAFKVTFLNSVGFLPRTMIRWKLYKLVLKPRGLLLN